MLACQPACQCFLERGRIGITFLRLPCQCLRKDGVECWVEIRLEFGRPRGLLRRHLVDQLQHVSLERPAAGQQLVKNHAQTVRIAFRSDWAEVEAGLLRCHIGSRPQQCPICGRVFPIVLDASEAEVGQHWLTVLDPQHYVGRLEVPMDDPDAVNCGQCIGNLFDEGDSLTAIDESLFFQTLCKSLTLDVGHDHERPPVFFADIVDWADVVVLNRRGGPGLAEEPLSGLGLLRCRTGKVRYFDGHMAAQIGVLCFENRAHAALAEWADYTIAANPFRDASGLGSDRCCGCRARRNGHSLQNANGSPVRGRGCDELVGVA